MPAPATYSDTRPEAPADAKTLPARYYTDPGIFLRERERIHRAMWTAVCRSEELPEAGSYRLVEVAGDSLVALRDADGRARAHHNVCRHRGTRLLEEDAGRLPGAVSCPYHAWTYGLDGSLRSAPHMERAPGFDPADYPLVSANCGEWGGSVFCRVERGGESLAEQLGPAAERLAPWGLESLTSVHSIEYDLRANWKLVLQNFSECLHCPVIHPQLQRVSHYLSGENYPVTPGTVGSAMDLADGADSLTVSGRRVAPPLPGVGPEDRRRVLYFVLLPNLLLCLHPDYAVTGRLEPLAVDRTRIRCDWLFAPESAAAPGFDPAPAVEFWDATNRQDWRVCESAQAGIASSAYRPGPYSNREDQLWEIDRLVLDRLS